MSFCNICQTDLHYSYIFHYCCSEHSCACSLHKTHSRIHSDLDILHTERYLQSIEDNPNSNCRLVEPELAYFPIVFFFICHGPQFG